MADDSTPVRARKFRIEGTGRMLEALARAINSALKEARATPYRMGLGSVATDDLTIEIEAIPGEDNLRYIPTSIDEAAEVTSGWAEKKRCDECQELVALLLDDAYLETGDGGVICCECYRRIEDGRR
ncbi:MAG: hypothetical protein Q7S58_06145 [Candidatus Binatus sp.]|uniref:hypothetical protein n=1 Tax=Candidatus Binatus sp. TaxID=2811406 RepID=UPI002720D1AD|nr:hypothetical protein [Candidatus Binatus sp.]MDO8431977.1 hypothetical protein [Candidatus Binatus sp.]